MQNKNIPAIRDGEKREWNDTVTSYVEKKNELLVSVPEVMDWEMFSNSISPELVDVLQMQHHRLQKQGLTIKIREKDIFGRLAGDRIYSLQHVSQHPEGSYSLGILRKRIRRCKEYYREKKRLSKVRDRVRTTYFIQQEAEEQPKVFLEDTTVRLQELYIQIDKSELERKKPQSVLSFWITLILSWFGIAAVTNIFYLVSSVFCLNMFPDWNPNIVLSCTLLSAALINFIGRGMLIVSRVNRMSRLKSYKVLQRIGEQWPDFCMEKFMAMAGSRLKCIFLADNMAQIGSFVSCDLTNALPDYANVVDCEITHFHFRGISQDENYQYIDVRQKVRLTGDLGERMKRKKLTVKMRLQRPKDSIMYTDFYHDWYIGKLTINGKEW